MNENYHLVIAAGGTGGHIYPGVAVAEEFIARYPAGRVTFIITGKKLEQEILERENLKMVNLQARAFLGKGLVAKILTILKAPFFLLRAIGLLRELKPTFILGCGGYPAFFPVLAAWCLGIPRAIQEQNAAPGVANRILSRFVQIIFQVPGKHPLLYRAEHHFTIANPVRRKFYLVGEQKRERARQGQQRLRVLICGGSQGARSINSAILDNLDFFSKFNIDLEHQTGREDYQRVVQAYLNANLNPASVKEFITDLDRAYAQADLLIARAGAMTVAESAVACCPAIFIPLNIAQGHQLENVRDLLERQACFCLEDNAQLTPRLGELLREIYAAPSQLEQVRLRLLDLAEDPDDRPATLVVDMLVNLISAE